MVIGMKADTNAKMKNMIKKILKKETLIKSR